MMIRVFVLYILLSCAAICSAYADIGEHWEVVGRSPFDGRREMQFAEFDGRLWAMGGHILHCDDETCWEVIYDDLWVSDNAKDWRLVLEHAPFGTALPWYDRQLIAFADHLYYMGGVRWSEDDSLQCEFFYWLSKDGIHWETIGDTNVGIAGLGRECVVFKDRLHILGTGYSSADGVSWDYSDAYSPPPFDSMRSPVSAVAHGDYIYAFYPQRVWRSPDGFQWTELEGNTDVLAPVRGFGLKLLSFGGYLWLGGELFPSGVSVFRSLDGKNWNSECSFQCPLRYGGMATLRERLYVYDSWWPNLAISLPCADYLGKSHSSDRSRCGSIDLSELLRVVQLYAFGGYHCEAGSEDGYAPGLGDKGPIEGETDGEGPGGAEGGMEGALEGAATPCLPHSSDYAPADGRISLNELLRLVQLYNAGDYRPCGDEELTEDGFCSIE